MRTSRNRRSQTGFTLLELVVVMVLLGLMTSLALPSMQRWHAGLVARSDASAVVDALQAAAFNAGVQKQDVRMDASSFVVATPGEAGPDPDSAPALTPDGKKLARIILPPGWQVGRSVPATFGGNGLCTPGLIALQSASGAAMIFQVQGPLCHVEWTLDHGAGQASGTGAR